MNKKQGINFGVGKKCIIRSYSAGVWFGEIAEKTGNEVIIKNARRLWRWKTKKSISLSAVAMTGVDADGCDFPPAVNSVWLEAIEIIPCTKSAIKSIEEVEDAQAKIEAE